MNNYLNYPKRKFSANGKLQSPARRGTQQDVEGLAEKQVRQHGPAGQGRDWGIQCLALCWQGLSQVYQVEEQSFQGKDQVKDFSGELDRHKSMVGSWQMLL